MRIDWFTAAAQLVNFLVLAWILTRLLYRPVVAAIAEREKRTAAVLAEAQAKVAAAEAARAVSERERSEFESARHRLWDKAVAEVDVSQKALLEQARHDLAEQRTKWLRALAVEKEDLRRELRLRLETEIWAVVRKVLQDLSGLSLEQALAEAFARKIESASPKERQSLAKAIGDGGGPTCVRTALALPPEARSRIAQALRAVGFDPAAVRFEPAPELVAGIELTAGGYKIEWNVDRYLGDLERSVASVVEQAHEPAESSG